MGLTRKIFIKNLADQGQAWWRKPIIPTLGTEAGGSL